MSSALVWLSGTALIQVITGSEAYRTSTRLYYYKGVSGPEGILLESKVTLL